jgi:hypothetical protein
VLLLVCGWLAPGCTKLATHDAAPPVAVIPLTFFGTPSRAIQIEFDPRARTSRIRLDAERWLSLTHPGLPLCILDGGKELVVCGREVFSGRLWINRLDLTSGASHDVALPEALRTSMFRQAAGHGDDVFLVVYDVIDRQNVLRRLRRDAAAQLVLDPVYREPLGFGGRYEDSSNILTAVQGDTLYFCSDRTCYGVRSDSGATELTSTDLGEHIRILELAATGDDLALLCQDMREPALARGVAYPDVNPFIIVELRSAKRTTFDDPAIVPYKLRCEDGGLTYSTLDGPQDLAELLLLDLRQADSSGVMKLGCNNEEGRVPWAQVYYLNGMLDFLRDWGEPADQALAAALAPLRDSIRRRLDLEMWLIDRLLDDGEPGMSSRRYSYDRIPAVYAVQTGRTLRLFERYLSELPDSLPLRNYASFKSAIRGLRGHIETMVLSPDGDDWVQPGNYFLRWPRGSEFPFDGLPLPFNHQNDWAAGATYDGDAALRDMPVGRAAHDVVELLLDIECFRRQPPANYQWHYWWGKAREGWSPAENVSLHTPEYPGDQSMAHISYRSIDAMAILTVGRVYSDLATEDVVSYLRDAVEEGGVYPFVAEEFAPLGELPRISRGLALHYLRMDADWNLQNAFWAYRALAGELGPVSDPGPRRNR